MRLMIPKIEANFPDFLVVGAGKSGTTSLYHYLKQHCQVFLPQRKELWFWHQNRNSNRAIFNVWPREVVPITLHDYLAWFAAARTDQVVGEVCPSYLYYHDLVIESLRDFHPRWQDVKIVIILRDPLERIKSEYRFVKACGLDPQHLDFRASIMQEAARRNNPALLQDLHYLAASQYCAKVAHFLDSFRHVRVFLYDELKRDANGLLAKLFAFLGVDPTVADRIDTTQQFNVTSGRLVPRSKIHHVALCAARVVRNWVPNPLKNRGRATLHSALLKTEHIHYDRETLDWLREQLKPDVQALSRLIGTDLSDWLQDGF